MPRKALGKGLGALIAGVDAADETGAILQLSPSMIQPNPFQPRRDFPQDSIRDLAASIKTHGMLQPLVVRETDDGYQLIAGERRLRASQEAGLSLVPALLEKADDSRMLMIALVENLQREELAPLDEAAAYRELIDRFNLSQGEVAEQVGRDRSTVANALRLLKLPREIRDLLASGNISAGHARSLLSVHDPAEQLDLARRIVEGRLSVREAEKRSRRTGKVAAPSTRAQPGPEIVALQEKLKRHFGTKVVIRPVGQGSSKAAGGRIEIDYYSDEDLERILELIGVGL
jgi:ParB family chromosome partitioning protein